MYFKFSYAQIKSSFLVTDTSSGANATTLDLSIISHVWYNQII